MADDQLISIAAAARELRLNKSTLCRQVKSGAVRSHDGKVKLSEVYEDRAKNIDAAIWSNRSKKPVTAQAPLHGDDAGTVEIDGVILDINSAKALKETYLGRLAKLKFKVESASLVDAAVVHKAVFEMARLDRDGWTNWPARVSPMMAAELGIDQVKLAVVLEKHVREHLADQSRSALRLAS